MNHPTVGVDYVFGVPGDYVLGFFRKLAGSPIRHIGTTREDTAAFAADGYARCRGIGALAVTYGIGALNVVNGVAGAYAESSPVVDISGAPGIDEQRKAPLLHNRFGSFRSELTHGASPTQEICHDRLEPRKMRSLPERRTQGRG
jgi:indolepyruvate decarboxylase